MPSISRSWSSEVNGPRLVRRSRIRCAVTGPTPAGRPTAPWWRCSGRASRRVPEPRVRCWYGARRRRSVSPSTTLRARFRPCGRMPGLMPPAALTASATRAPLGTVTRPGVGDLAHNVDDERLGWVGGDGRYRDGQVGWGFPGSGTATRRPRGPPGRRSRRWRRRGHGACGAARVGQPALPRLSALRRAQRNRGGGSATPSALVNTTVCSGRGPPRPVPPVLRGGFGRSPGWCGGRTWVRR